MFTKTCRISNATPLHSIILICGIRVLIFFNNTHCRENCSPCGYSVLSYTNSYSLTFDFSAMIDYFKESQSSTHCGTQHSSEPDVYLQDFDRVFSSTSSRSRLFLSIWARLPTFALLPILTTCRMRIVVLLFLGCTSVLGFRRLFLHGVLCTT